MSRSMSLVLQVALPALVTRHTVSGAHRAGNGSSIALPLPAHVGLTESAPASRLGNHIDTVGGEILLAIFPSTSLGSALSRCPYFNPETISGQALDRPGLLHKRARLRCILRPCPAGSPGIRLAPEWGRAEGGARVVGTPIVPCQTGDPTVGSAPQRRVCGRCLLVVLSDYDMDAARGSRIPGPMAVLAADFFGLRAALVLPQLTAIYQLKPRPLILSMQNGL